MEQELINKAQNGDQAAFQKLVHMVLPNVLALGYKMLGNNAEAEDMAQEVMVSFWQNIKKYDPEQSKLSTWLYRITANRCLDYLRRKKPDQLNEEYDEPVEAVQEKEYYEKQIGDLVDLSLKDLPERQYLALVLFHFQGHTQQEIAEMMECSSEAVESLLARARRAMKKSLHPIWQTMNEENYESIS